MKIPDPGQKCVIGCSPHLILKHRATVPVVQDERARANFLSQSPKNFPAARSDHGKIESVLQTPAPLALRGRNAAQARLAREALAAGRSSITGTSAGWRSLREMAFRVAPPNDRADFISHAEIENMNFLNRNEHRGRSNCAYQAAAEVIAQPQPGLSAWGVKELSASSRPKGIPATGSCATLEDSESSKAKWSFIHKEFAQ